MNRGSRNIGQAPIVFKSGLPISIVCVAATFTSITYANNGGKVQLVSSGVHGLTTSPAVGASVYVSWAGGTGVSGLYLVLSVDDAYKITIDLIYSVGLGTPTAAISNTNIEVARNYLPPMLHGSLIKASAKAVIPASANLKGMYLYIDNSMCISRSTTTADRVSLAFEGDIKNTSISTQISTGQSINDGAANISFMTSSVNTLTSKPISIVCKMAAPNEVINVFSYIIEVFL